jgi:hypothetical protein
MLTEVEKNSLMLSLNNGMSTWEAGEVLGISHYKYLEIRSRAEKLLKLFASYFDKVGKGSLFAPDSVASPRFKDYIEATIEKRLGQYEARLYSGDSIYYVKNIAMRDIEKNMNKLFQSENTHDQALYILIKEFDRWNTHRLLPVSLQMPSAYKRRQNKRDKVYINYLNTLPQHKVEALIHIFRYKPRSRAKKLFVAIISEDLYGDERYTIINVKDEKSTLERLTKLSIYVFKTEDLADTFGYMVTRFYEKTSESKLGQKFWPEYRDITSQAVNFKELNNINFYIDKLDNAYDDIDNKYAKRKRPSKPNSGAKRAPLEIF